MAAYVVVQIDVRDPTRYETYKSMAPESIRAHGGRYLARGGATETLEGTWSPARFVILEFPDMDSARAWWSSMDYAEAKALRQATADTQMLLVEGHPGA